jgi:hypothetical protein
MGRKSESRVPEIGTPGLMSEDGIRGDGHWPQATAPILDSTPTDLALIWFRCENQDFRTLVFESKKAQVLRVGATARFYRMNRKWSRTHLTMFVRIIQRLLSSRGAS